MELVWERSADQTCSLQQEKGKNRVYGEGTLMVSGPETG